MNQTNPIRSNMMSKNALDLALLALTSCATSSNPEVEAAAPAAFQTGTPGGVIAGTYQTIAMVAAISAANRRVTLASPDGIKTVFKAGHEVRNFDQIRIGDQVCLSSGGGTAKWSAKSALAGS